MAVSSARGAVVTPIESGAIIVYFITGAIVAYLIARAIITYLIVGIIVGLAIKFFIGLISLVINFIIELRLYSIKIIII